MRSCTTAVHLAVRGELVEPQMPFDRLRANGQRAYVNSIGSCIVLARILTVAVLAVTPLLAIFHQVAARHAVCEHGELVESGDNRLSANDPAQVDADWARGQQTTPTRDFHPDSDSTLHGHTHCSVGTLAKSNVAVLPCTEVITVMCEVALGSLHHSEFAYVRTILLSAPKTSPPHAVS